MSVMGTPTSDSDKGAITPVMFAIDKVGLAQQAQN